MINKESFSAFAGGNRNSDDNFYGAGMNGYCWSKTVIFKDVIYDLLLIIKAAIYDVTTQKNRMAFIYDV